MRSGPSSGCWGAIHEARERLRRWRDDDRGNRGDRQRHALGERGRPRAGSGAGHGAIRRGGRREGRHAGGRAGSPRRAGRVAGTGQRLRAHPHDAGPGCRAAAGPGGAPQRVLLFGEWQATITSRDAVGRDAEVIRQLDATRRGGDVLPGATLPDIARLTAVAGRIAGDVANVAERVQVAFDDQAAREMRASLRNFAELSTVLAQTVREQSNNLTTVSSDVRGASSRCCGPRSCCARSRSGSIRPRRAGRSGRSSWTPPRPRASSGRRGAGS